MTNRLSGTVMTAEGEIPKVQKFTEALLASLPQPLPGKDYYLVDADVLNTKPYRPYFQLRVTPKGKKFKLVFTVISKKTGKKQTDKKDFPNCSSKYPDLSVDNARRMAKALFKDVNNPHTPDPWATKKALMMKNGEPTFERLLKEYIIWSKTEGNINSVGTERGYTSLANKHLKQFLSRPFSELNNRKTLTKLLRDASMDGVKPMYGAVKLVGHVADFSQQEYFDDDDNPDYYNISKAILKNHKSLKYGERKDSLEGEPDFDKFFKLLESDELKEYEKEFLLFTLLTGYRSGILFRGLSWKALNLDKSTYTLIPKNRPRGHQGTEMPLPRYLNALLRRRADEKQASHQRVFPINEVRINRLLKAAMGERKTGRGFTLKHLRKTFVTFAEALEIDPPVIAALVNHKWGENTVTDTHYKDWEAVQKLREEWGHGDTRLSDALETIVSKMLEYMPDYSPDDGTKVVRIKAASK